MCNANISPTYGPPSNLKLPRVSHQTPWGWAQKHAWLPAMLPGSTEALSGNAEIVLDPFDKNFDVEGAPWPPLSVPYHPMAPGALTRWFIGWQWLCSVHICKNQYLLCLVVDGLVAQGKGVYTIFLLMLKTLKSASMSWWCCRTCLALPTASPGHGSAFQHLPRRRHGQEGVWSLFGAYRVCVWVW